MAVCSLLLWLLTPGLCSNEIYQEVLSPDNAYKAVVFQRNCGATTDFSTQVSVLKASDTLPDRAGNVFIMDGPPEQTKIHVQWEADRSLSITYSPEYEVFRARKRLRDFLTVITIRYQQTSP